MLRPILLLAFLVAAATNPLAMDIEDRTAPHVTTKQGTLKGVVQTTLFGRPIYSFKGVRYAEPPVGELRFKAPVRVKSWQGVYDATKDGPACPQPGLRPVSEDCLFLNVHTPKLPKNGKNPKYPVIIYIHPGSFTTLTGNSAFVGPQYLLDKNVVLVSMNYRLATLGFMSTGDELAPGNNGMKDQVQAMRWVKENIARFGGNPDRVLLAGYSVGGISVSLHLVSPMSKGLFHRAIIMSGSMFGSFIEKTEQFDLAQKQARVVGCPDDTSNNIINCLKTISGERLGDSLEEFRIFGNDPQFIWQPVIEPDFGQERFLTENPYTSVQCGRVANVPVMTGISADELIFLAAPIITNATWLEVYNRDWNKIAPYAFYYDPNSPRADNISAELKNFYFGGKPISSNDLVPLGELYSDALAGFAINRGAEFLSKHIKKPVWNYMTSYKGQYSYFASPDGKKYVVHFDDMLYVFWDSLQFPMFKETDPEVKMIRKITTLWANMARKGNPIPRRTAELDLVFWKPVTVGNRNYLDIGERLVLKKDLYSKRYAKFAELFPVPLAECLV